MNTPVQKKHPQSILGFFSAFFNVEGFHDGLTEYPFDEFVEKVQSMHVIGERNFLENYLGVRQALPAAIIRERDAGGVWKYWLFKRTDKIGEGRIAGKTTCIWGGHVDAVDAVFNNKSVLDLRATLTAGRDREQGEEYRIYKEDSPFEKDQDVRLPLTPANQFIANSTVEVDNYHVAILYTIDLPEGHKVEVLEEELIGIPTPMSAQEALDAHELGDIELESWALIYFGHVRAQELLDSGARIEVGELTEEDRAKGYSWPLTFKPAVIGLDVGKEGGDQAGYQPRPSSYEGAGTIEKEALDWDHGSFYNAYGDRGGENWDEFKLKVIMLFGTGGDFEADQSIVEVSGDAVAATLFPVQAKELPFFFASKDRQYTVTEMLKLVDDMDMASFRDRVLIHQDFDRETMKPIGDAYRMVGDVKVSVERQLLRDLVLDESKESLPVVNENTNETIGHFVPMKETKKDLQ